jgi:novobiocin biosynthesis protein NovU/D-mycarose 3-C-methyltransferase
MYKTHTHCRACGEQLNLVGADFGITPLVNAFRKPIEEQAGYAPLKIMLCEKCWLPQLSVVVNPHLLYDNYPYAHSTTETLVRHIGILAEILHTHRPALGRVLEVGSNDGLLLEKLKALKDVEAVVGIDPAGDLVRIARDRGVPTFCGLFGHPIVTWISDTHLPFNVVLARHVFAHMDNWRETLSLMDRLTTEDAIVAIEVQYAPDLLEHVEWDQVYHEHLSYVTLTGLDAACEGTAFRIQDAVRVAYNGGSAVIILRKRSWPEKPTVAVRTMMNLEPRKTETWFDFENKARHAIATLKSEVSWRNLGGQLVAGYGAPAKCTNWVHACGFTSKDLPFVVDAAPMKQGKLVPGSDIPVVGRDEIERVKPLAMVLFAWNFEEEILKKEAAYIGGGGVFIVPIPTSHTVPSG